MEDLLRGPSELGHPALDPDELNLQVGGRTEGAEVRIQSSPKSKLERSPVPLAAPLEAEGLRAAGGQKRFGFCGTNRRVAVEIKQ